LPRSSRTCYTRRQHQPEKSALNYYLIRKIFYNVNRSQMALFLLKEDKKNDEGN